MVSESWTDVVLTLRIDGINNPEWKQNQVYSSATGPHVNVSEYVFDTVA
jgi:hypothetical protein